MAKFVVVDLYLHKSAAADGNYHADLLFIIHAFGINIAMGG